MGITLPQATAIWSGDEWEKYIAVLLGMRYAPGDFIPVPSDDHGDLGMDGIGRDGRIYQCYAPENEPLAADVRKKKLKDKISRDLAKLVEKQDEHQAILGGILVERWILVTPILHSKDILAHANVEADKIRKLGCPYISPKFEATAVTENEFLGAEKKRFCPSSCAASSPLSGRKSTYRTVRISQAGSDGRGLPFQGFSAIFCGRRKSLENQGSHHDAGVAQW